jgi:hypothetical protein
MRACSNPNAFGDLGLNPLADGDGQNQSFRSSMESKRPRRRVGGRSEFKCECDDRRAVCASRHTLRIRSRGKICAAMALLALLGFVAYPGTSGSQEAAAVVRGQDEAIPRANYKSWSLFLICNPQWILPESNQRVEELYQQFQAFGAAIGPDNLAVWFLKGDPNRPKAHKDVDFGRSAQFCSKLKLPPSKSPYVLLMTQYPGESLPNAYPKTFPTQLGNHVLLSLNGSSTRDTSRLLGALADQLITSDLSHLKVDSDEYWSSLQHSYVAVRDNFLGMLSKVTVSFDAGPVKTEIKF